MTLKYILLGLTEDRDQKDISLNESVVNNETPINDKNATVFTGLRPNTYGKIFMRTLRFNKDWN